MNELGSSPLSSTPSSTSSSSSILQNFPLISAFVAFAIAQSIKFFTTWCKEKRWDAKQLIASGGMPSSHSSTVTALAVAIGCQDGFGGSVFATAMILACVVMYDAVGVRLHAGKQAETILAFVMHTENLQVALFHLILKLKLVLNQIVCELPAEHPLAETRPLRELLGHTPCQVAAGSFMGMAVALTGHLINTRATES